MSNPPPKQPTSSASLPKVPAAAPPPPPRKATGSAPSHGKVHAPPPARQQASPASKPPPVPGSKPPASSGGSKPPPVPGSKPAPANKTAPAFSPRGRVATSPLTRGNTPTDAFAPDAFPPPSRLNPMAPPLPAMRAPMPSDDGYMTNDAKMSLADIALQLRDEQLQARIVHYRADLETNAELDAITAQVVSELNAMRESAQIDRMLNSSPPGGDRVQLGIELSSTLSEMLGRLFRKDRLAVVFERRLAEVSKRFARLFFRSELHEKIAGAGDKPRMMRFPEQALYHLFARSEETLLAELEAMPFATPSLFDETVSVFSNMVKELRDGFLAKTTPELNELLKVLHTELRNFLLHQMPTLTETLAQEVVRDAKLAEAKTTAGYKISASHFPIFRKVFERRFMERLVPFVEDHMLEDVRKREGKFRIETIRFVADPQIFSDVCEVICDSVYDMLYNDGFLDLPTDWRARLTVER